MAALRCVVIMEILCEMIEFFVERRWLLVLKKRKHDTIQFVV